MQEGSEGGAERCQGGARKVQEGCKEDARGEQGGEQGRCKRGARKVQERSKGDTGEVQGEVLMGSDIRKFWKKNVAISRNSIYNKFSPFEVSLKFLMVLMVLVPKIRCVMPLYQYSYSCCIVL